MDTKSIRSAAVSVPLMVLMLLTPACPPNPETLSTDGTTFAPDELPNEDEGPLGGHWEGAFEEFYPLDIGNEWTFFYSGRHDGRPDRIEREIVAEHFNFGGIYVYHIETHVWNIYLPDGMLPTYEDAELAGFIDVRHWYVVNDDRHPEYGYWYEMEHRYNPYEEFTEQQLDYWVRVDSDKISKRRIAPHIVQNGGIQSKFDWVNQDGYFKYLADNINRFGPGHGIVALGCNTISSIDVAKIDALASDAHGGGMALGIFAERDTCNYLKTIYAHGFGPVQRRQGVLLDATVGGVFYDFWPQS